MPKADSIPHGAPIWMDLSSSDVERAKSFYGDLFGWTTTGSDDQFGGYRIAWLGDSMVAGLMQNQPEMGDTPNVWTVYLKTDDSAATARAVTEAGGQVVMEPMEVGSFGMMTVISDPSGAFLGTWQPNEHNGFGVWGEQGAPCWFELMSLDIDAASAFYEKAFGVEFKTMNGEGGPAYKTFHIDNDDRAGLMDARGLMPEGVPSNWLVYWGADDPDALTAKAVELGGSIMAPPADTPWGRFVLLADPMGATFALISAGDA